MTGRIEVGEQVTEKIFEVFFRGRLLVSFLDGIEHRIERVKERVNT